MSPSTTEPVKQPAPTHFYAPFYKNVTNGPAKFARIVAKLAARRGDAYQIISSDLGAEELAEAGHHLRQLPPPPAWVRTSIVTQLYRSRTYERWARRHATAEPGHAPRALVFNNAITALACARKLPYPTVGFINDDNNLLADAAQWYRPSVASKLTLRRMERRAAAAVDAVVVNSNYLRELVVRRYAIAAEKVHVLYKGLEIDPDPLPQRPFTNDQSVRLLFVKSDFERGGLPALIKALELLQVDYPDRKLQLDVVGVTEAAFRARFPSWRAPEHCSLHFHGTRGPAQVRTLMRQAQIFCSPAHAEALGVANMEAMAQHLPVVTTDVGGIPEVTNAGEHAWVVQPGDAKSIAAGIAACWQRPDVTARKVLVAREFVERNFDERLAYDRLQEIIAYLLAERGE